MNVTGTYTGFCHTRNGPELLPVLQKCVDFVFTNAMLTVNPFMNPTGKVWAIIIKPE